MNFKADLADGQKLLISNENGQTHLAVNRDGDGNTQSQATSFATGEWEQAPTLYQTATGAVLAVEADQGEFYFALENGAIRNLNAAPKLDGAAQLEMQKASAQDVEALKTKPLKPMEPMEPMKPMAPMKPM